MTSLKQTPQKRKEKNTAASDYLSKKIEMSKKRNALA
jgi:hypothetical protein